MAEYTKTDRAICALLYQGRIVLHSDQDRNVAKILINELFAMMEQDKMSIADVQLCRSDVTEAISDLAFLLSHDLCRYGHVKQMFARVWAMPYLSVIDILVETRMLDELDESDLVRVVAEVIEKNPKIIETIRRGKLMAVGALVGQIMKAQKADPKRVKELIHAQLGLG